MHTLSLLSQFPDAHVFIAGSFEVTDIPDEATLGTEILISFGVSPERITSDSRSVDTWDNARFAYEALSPKADQTWLLVTSAAHMPRSIGAFRAAGWSNLIAWPVDVMLAGTRMGPWISYGLKNLCNAAHEGIGLFAYWMNGRSEELFPVPSGAK